MVKHFKLSWNISLSAFLGRARHFKLPPLILRACQPDPAKPLTDPSAQTESRIQIQKPTTQDRSSKCRVHLTDSQLQQLPNVSVSENVSVTLGVYSLDPLLHFEWQLHLLSLHIAWGSINAYYCPLSVCLEGVSHRHRNSIVQLNILRPFCNRQLRQMT